MRREPPGRSARGRISRGRPTGREEEDEIPEVYREMLAEAELRSPDISEADRPIKKRKVGAQRATTSDVVFVPQVPLPMEDQGQASRQVQTVYDEPTSEESDMEWEEVDLQQAPAQSIQIPPVAGGDNEPLQITLDNHEGKRRNVVSRQKPLTAAEKKLRLDIHKVHVLCLLRHVQIRNLWCNDDELQSFLKRMLPKQVIAMLNPAEDKPQYSRSTTFVDGLNQASDAFSRRFRVNRPGLKRAHWVDPEKLKQKVESIMPDAEVFLSKEDFCTQARTMQGSRDFGAQLFCALLRSAAVEARLICSLQPLSFSGMTKNMTPNKPDSPYIVISSDDHDTSADDQQMSGASPTPASRSRRLGRPQFNPSRSQKTSIPGPGFTARASPYPVFWVEAFNEAVQKWVPVDPLVTKTIAKPSKFEPPFSDPSNCMSYVVGFEEDASARDVTRRYAKAFNAKTRKLRVESTKDGERWWARTMGFYEKPFLEDRDEVEISELTAKTAAEPMPRNVQDFKDHPIYAIERQLRRNEVVFPKRVIGQVSLGKSGSKDQVLVPVYRRSDVHVVRSADKWYRLGRDIKIGEQPLKHIRVNRNKDVGFSEDEHDNESGMEIPLYAYFQTEVYTPPPVVQGKVPKNSYGNLDVYVPSMVPPGGVHIKHPQAASAARVLSIDYADAVTGFDFKGRHGTAVFQGVVVASECQEALEEVLYHLEDERRQAESEEKSREMLQLWKHFLLKLRIAERVKSYAIEGEESAGEISENYEDPEETGGGFIPEPEQEMADTGKFSTYQQSTEQEPRGHTYNEASTNNGALGDEAPRGGIKSDESASHIEAISVNPSARDIPKASRRPRYNLIVVPNKKADSNETGTSQRQPQQQHEESPGIAELEPAAEAESVKSSGETGPAGSSEAPIMVDTSTTGGSKSASVEILSRAASQTQSRTPTPEEVDETLAVDDNGSLLSHDPEDEDAIPEWLV
ncbi:DNA repair protein rhp41 [Aspergillus udagawae]|nr:DNA repair protein rhp41 [Aspergillus udagawae]